MDGKSCFLLFVALFGIGCNGLATDDYELTWHPKWKMPEYGSVPDEDNPYHSAAQWVLPGPGSVKTSWLWFGQHKSPVYSDIKFSLWAYNPQRMESTWSNHIAFMVKNKHTGEHIPWQKLPSRNGDYAYGTILNNQVMEKKMVNATSGEWLDDDHVYCDGMIPENRLDMSNQFVTLAGPAGVRTETRSQQALFTYSDRMWCQNGEGSMIGRNVSTSYSPTTYTMGFVDGVHFTTGTSFRGKGGKRKLVFSYTPNPHNLTDRIDIETPEFNILSDRHIVEDIKLMAEPPRIVTANNPFSVSFGQLDPHEGNLVTTGWPSKNYLRAGVHNRHKLWHIDQLYGQSTVFSSENQISGPDAVFQKNTMEWMAYKQMTAGQGTLNFALEEVMDAVTVNFTVMARGFPYRPCHQWMPMLHSFWKHHTPWGWQGNLSRHATDGGGLAWDITHPYKSYEKVNGKVYLRNKQPTDKHPIFNQYKMPGIMALTFKVIAQTGATLKFVENSPDEFTHSSNRQVDGIEVELVDANGYRVKSGPDSSLLVSVATDKGTVSKDANFNLKRGVGVFSGSVITANAITGNKLVFTVGSLPSIESKPFDVKPNLKIVVIGATAKETDKINQAKTAVAVANIPGLALDFIDTDLASTLYDMLFNPTGEKPASVIVGGDQDAVSTAIAMASHHQATVVDYKSAAWTYAADPDSVSKRIRHSSEFSSYIMGRFIKSRNWNTVILIWDASSNAALRMEAIAMLSMQGIVIKEKPLPADSSAKSMDAFFTDINELGHKIIVSVATGANLKIALEGAIRNKMTPEDGYQWVGMDAFAADFPHSMTDASKFDRSIVLQVDYPSLPDQESQNLALAYDSLDALSAALKKVKDDQNTINLANMDAAFEQLSGKGLTGKFMFGSNGERVNTHVAVQNIAAGNLVTKSFLSIPRKSGHLYKGMQLVEKWADNATEPLLYAKTDAHSLSYIKISKMKGVVKDDRSETDSAVVVGHDTVPFDHQGCDGGCGGGVIDPADKTKYKHGTCHKGICECNLFPIGSGDVRNRGMPQYTGKNCEVVECSYAFVCDQGTCSQPGVCTCNQGYRDVIRSSFNTTKCTEDIKIRLNESSAIDVDKAVQEECFGNLMFSDTDATVGYLIGVGNRTDEISAKCTVPSCSKQEECNIKSQKGKCIGPGACECVKDYYGSDCSRKCPDCGKNGHCDEGADGTGECVCDNNYTGPKCGSNILPGLIGGVIAAIAFIVLVIWLAFYWLRHQKVKESLNNLEWQVNWDEIRFRQKQNRSSMKSMQSMVSMMTSRMSRLSGRMSGKSGKEDKVVCQNQGNWNGKEIVIKTINKNNLNLTAGILKEIVEIKDIIHMNLCAFIGAVVQPPTIAVLNEVCGKGSLEDVLFNGDNELDWSFKFSMLKDICRGMQYLHDSKIGWHGRLKTSNCLVDNKWCVKIADYGLREFKSGQEGVRVFNPGQQIGTALPTEDELELCDYYNLLWTAPEIIATGVSHPNHVTQMGGTQKGDVYSFSVIMAEMCTHDHPFSELDHLGPEELVPMVGGLIPLDDNLEKTYFGDKATIRPFVPMEKLPEEKTEEFQKLMNLCWHEDAEGRPAFKDAMKELNNLSPHRGELMDNLIDLMTHYTNTLEGIISEKTNDLRSEKEAGEALLSKMLPEMIANELKTGKNPLPEYFGCVTIQFSDVVGFGAICKDASPVQVVELLNCLYDTMDDVIAKFDCYKVETIADSYVVASGIPIRNGDKHAGEIATMALTLLAAIDDVSYAHLPGSQVQLRIGINSGSIVGGVVGLRMPRYCLFGDTMNTASRMESGGYALKIHISESCYNLLEKEGGFQFISRGEREIKGKGIMKTFWLVGKDGLDVTLPSEDKAASLSMHHFK